MRVREFVPNGLKEYFRLVRAKLRFQDSFIGSPYVSSLAAIGKGCRIANGVVVNQNVSVGDYTYVNPFSLIGSGLIGRYCSIGYYCEIGMHRHPIEYLSSSPLTYGPGNALVIVPRWNDFSAPPEIGNDVWIGSAVHVMQGVRIGSGAVIGAGAVVTHDIPAYSVAFGVPARVSRMRFDDQVVAKLLEWQWWNQSPEELKSFQQLFGKEDWRAHDIPQWGAERARLRREES